MKLVRLGHPARLLPQVLESALDAQVFELLNFIRENFNDEFLDLMVVDFAF